MKAVIVVTIFDGTRTNAILRRAMEPQRSDCHEFVQ
jgi:hypothetical protein